MLVGLKCMFSDNSLSVNRVVFSRVSDIAFSNSDVVIVESELNTGDAERLKYLHISPVNLIFLLKPASGMSGTGREAVCIDTELSGNEYLMMRQALKNGDQSEEGQVVIYQKRNTCYQYDFKWLFDR